LDRRNLLHSQGKRNAEQGPWRGRAISFLILCSLSLFALACSAGDDESAGAGDGVVVTPIQQPPSQTAGTSGPQPTASAGASPSPATQPPGNGSALHGFIFPISGGCLPKGDQLMPNARRDYRQGVHEGVDLYGVDNCTNITRGTPVLAAKAGRVIRADADYQNLSPAELNALSANPTTPQALDRFRGRQVWIDHGNGIVTRYCHLDGIAAGLKAGDQVSQGQVIAYVGESGTPESVTNPGHEYHLHFELRVGEGYLGQGESAARVRELYTALFSPGP